MTASRGIILFGHGSRDPLWHQPILAVAQAVQAMDPAVLVRCAYLEITPPDLPSAAHDLVQHGVQQISVLPLFLGVGRHAREDLPELVRALRLSYPNQAITLLPAVGEDQRLIRLLAQIALSPIHPE